MTLFAITESPIGRLKISADNSGITEIRFTDLDVFATDSELINEAIQQLNEYFDGNRTSFDLPLNPIGTEFQRKVWAKLEEIPYGKLASYKDIAIKLGDAKKVRAVGGANNKNPISIIIPCHRVIGSDGSLVGYAGGLDRKKWLLNLEEQTLGQLLF